MDTQNPKRAADRGSDDKSFQEQEAALERTGRVEELIRLYESRSREVALGEAMPYLTKAAELARDRLKNLPRAEELLKRALLSAPDAKEPLLGLKAVYEARQDPAALVDVLEKLAAGAGGLEGASLLLKAADLHEQKLNRRDKAALCCQLASKMAPSERPPYRRVRQILLSDRRYPSALDSIDRERAALGDAGMADEYAGFAEQLLDDPSLHPLAQQALAQAGKLEPQSARVDKALKALQKYEQTWRERARMLKQASMEERDRKSAARLALAVARLHSWYEGPTSPKVKEALDRCFLLWPAMPEALDLIQQGAEKSGDHAAAVAVIEKMALDSRERNAQVDLWVRAGTLKLSKLNDAEGALTCFERAAMIDPSRGDACGLAAELFLDRGRFDEAVAILERHLVTVKDRTAQISQRLKLADLCVRQLKDTASARLHLQKVLQLDAVNAEAAFQLVRLMVDDEDTVGLEPLVELALAAPRPLPERLATCEAVAMLYEGKGRHKESFAVLARGLALDPSRAPLVTQMVDQARKAGAEQELPIALRRAAQSAPAPASTILWKSLANLLESPLSKPAEAEAAWREVLKRSPDDADAAQALSRLKVALPAAPVAPAATGEQDPRARLEAEAKRLEGAAAEPAALAAVYRKILQLVPEDVSALKRLGATCAAMGQWEEVARVAAHLGELAETPAERFEWRARLAQLYAERLSRKDEAAELYLALLAEGVGTAAVVGGLERLASQGVRQVEISQALAPHYGKSGDHQRQVASLLVQLSSAKSKDQAKQLLSLLANTHERSLLDPRAAFDFVLRGLALDPADATFRGEAVRLAKDLSAHAELARFLSDQAAKVPDAKVAATLSREGAAVAEEGGAVDEAAAALKAALERLPDDPAVLAQLIRLYTKAGRFAECDQVLRRRILSAEPSEKGPFYLQLSEVSAELNRPREAAQALMEGIRAGLSEEEHLPRLCELLEKAGRSSELATALARQIELAEKAGDKDKVARLTLKRAQLVESTLGDKAEALRNYSRILEQRPTDPDAIAALEHLLTDAGCREEAARSLIPAYEAMKDHRKLVNALEVVADAATDELEKVLALKQAAAVHLTHLRQPEFALGALARALRLAPADLSIRNAARQAAEDADSLDTFAEVLAEVLQSQAGPLKVALHRELAELYERKLSNREGAIAQLRAALELDPKNVEVLRALQRMHRAADEWAPLAPVLEGLAAVATEPGEKVALWREAALIHEQRLTNPERAALCWRQIAERDPLDREAAIALDRLYTTLDRPNELAFALELRRAQEGQSPQGRELAFRQAQLRQQRLNDSAGALHLYRQILTEDPGHGGAREALQEWARLAVPESAAALEILDPVLVQMGDHMTRVNLRKAQIPRALTEEKARLAAETRAIYERDLSRVDLAFAAALEHFAQGIDREGMRGDLERLARATSGWRELVKAYEAAANSLRQGDPALPALIRRAAELREQLGQPEEAIALWKELLNEFPQDRQALDSLGKLYERSRNAKNLSEVYARQAQLSQNPAERLELLLKAGAAYEAAGEDGPAIDAFRTALAIQRHPDALGALDRLYGKAGRTDEQADVLEQLASIAADPAARRGLMVRRAALLEKDGGPGEALRAYARVLELAPGDPDAVAGLERLLEKDAIRLEAARILEPIYRSLNDARKLVEVLDARLVAADVDRRAALLDEIAALRESLGQKPLAFAARLRAFAEHPEREDVREEVERLAAETGSFEELAAAYEDCLERGAQDALALDLWRRLAVIYGERLTRLDLAARAWEEVARRDPQNPRPLEALTSLYWKSREFKPLSNVMRRRIALEKSASVQVQLLFELGNLAEEMLADRAMAAACYQAILQRKPDDPNAINFLGRVLAESERYPEVAQLIARQIQLAEARGANEEAYDLMVRLGRLKLTRLNDPRGALETFQDVLRRKAAHAGAVGALEEMARSDNPLRGEAATALEPVFASGGEHLKLVQMLDSRVSTEVNPQERVALLQKIAELYAGPMANPSMAFLAATRALRERPDDRRSLSLCLSLAGPADATEELAAVLEDVAAKASEDSARAELYRTLAKLKEKTGEEDEALEAWRRVLELLPSDPEALEAAGGLLEAAGKAPELLEILRRQLTVVEDVNARTALFLRVAKLQEEGLRDPVGALVTLRRLLEVKPDDEGALERMEQLCQKQERWPELADVLARRIALLGPNASVDLKFRLGMVRELRLLDRQGAVALYAEITAADPRHAEALERLEGMAQREPQNVVVLDVLLRAFRAGGDGPKLAQTLEARAQATPDPFEKKGFLVELANLREMQGEPEMAFLAFFRAFKEDPNDAQVRAQLEKVAEIAKAYDELATAYEEELPRIAEDADAARVCLKMGDLYERRLDEPERAVSAYEKARSLDPKIAPQALMALDRLHADMANFEALAPVLEAEAQLTTDPAEKVALLFRLGQLYEERLQNPDRAAAAYEAVRALDANHLPSARLLERIYEAAGRHDKLFGILEAQRDLVTGPERERVLSRMAQVSAEGLSDVGHSIELYRELLAKNPRNEQAFAALEELLERANRFDEVRALLVQKIAQTLDPRELVRLNDKVGRVTLSRLGKPEEAIPYFKAALDRDPRHKGALDALREIYETLGKKDELVTILRRLVPVAEDAAGVKALRIRLAEVLADMGRREEAVEAARRALEVEPHAAADLARVQKIFLSLRAYPDAVRTLELKSQVHLAADERDQAVATLFEVVDLWRGPAGKMESAGSVLERILELDPANRQAYELACELYTRLNDWRSYAATLDRYLPNLVTDEEKVATLRDLMRVREQKLGQPDLAFMVACRALQLDPSNDQIREEVERLADETGSHEELAAVYEGVAENLPRGPLAERIYRVLAKVQDERIDEPEAAEASLRKILEFDPTNPAALESLANMFARRGRHNEYVVALEQKMEAAESIEQRKAILKEISRVYEEKNNNLDEAAAALQRAAELEPDVETLNALAALYRRQKAWTNVATTLLRSRDLVSDPQEKSRVQNEVALVYEREVGDDEAAVEAFRGALELDPANREAVDALERLYTKLDRPAELLHIYQRQLELSSDYRERVSIFFKSAGIWEDKYQNLANADICVESILQVDPANLQAIKTLERLRKAQERWEDLISVLDRHIQLVPAPEEKAALYVEGGDIFHQQLKQVDRAVQSYHRALEVDPACVPAMHALGTLYERSGNWPFALEMLAKEADQLGSSANAVELWHRMGKINEDMLMDTGSARSCYERALQIDPSYLPSIRALKGIHEGAKDWRAYEQALIQEAQRTEDPEAKSKALIEVAKFQAETKEDREGSARWYEDALRLVPDALEAAQPLADIYIGREEWKAAGQMMEIVTRKMTERAAHDPDGSLAKELCRQHYRLGYVSEKQGKKDRALAAYEKAYQLDATYLPALEGLGNGLVQAKRLDEALKVYQTILIHHREELTDLEVVEVYWQLGEIQVGLRQFDRAQNNFEKALAIDPGHEPTLRALVGLADNAGRWDKAAEYRRSLIQVLDGDAKFATSVELGVMAKEKLKDTYMAIDAYVSALKMKPDALAVMDALYVLYRETRQGAKAAEMVERMLANPELKGQPQKAKRVYFALGEIARDELKEADRAVAAFNAALDLDPRFVEAFSAIEVLLGGQKQWKKLEENYARMIQRLPKTEDTHAARMALWRTLGDLYLKILRQPEGALMAYQVVSTGLPNDPGVQETFAELAASQPGNEDKAVTAYRRALPNTLAPAKVVSALAELAARRKDYDGAWLAAQVSSGLLNQSGDAEKEILTKLTPYAKRREQAQQPLNDRLWVTHLFHPGVRGPLGELLSLLCQQAGHLYAAPLGQYNINPKKHRIDVASAQEFPLAHYRYVARLLGMEAVELYSPFLVATRERLAKRSNEPAPEPMVGVEICHTDPVCLKVGGKYLTGMEQKEAYYVLGRTMALLRPELALTQRMPAEQLEAVLAAVISLSAPSFRSTVHPNAINAERARLERALSDPARAALARVTREYIKGATMLDFKNYLEGAELTAARVGLFVAGELEPVKKMVLGETGAAFRVTPKAKLKELMCFALSEDLAALRVATATNVEVPTRR